MEGAGVRSWVLGSGSRGNAVLIECGDGAHILVDAGFSPAALARRLEDAGIAPESIEAVVLTHEHDDHAVVQRLRRCAGLGALCSAGRAECPALVDADVRSFEPGERSRGCVESRPWPSRTMQAEQVAVVVTSRRPLEPQR